MEFVFKKGGKDVIFEIEFVAYQDGIGSYEFWGATYNQSYLNANIVEVRSFPDGYELTEAESEEAINTFLQVEAEANYSWEDENDCN